MPRRPPRQTSEYGKQLQEKKKLRDLYNLRERQFSKYVKEILAKGARVGDASEVLVQRLESRFDNVIFRLGLAVTRQQARQFVSHGHFLVNDKPCNIPSFSLKKEDTVKIRPNSSKKAIFTNLPSVIAKYEAPSWLELNKEKLEGKVVNLPTLVEAATPVELSAVFEFYSR